MQELFVIFQKIFHIDLSYLFDKWFCYASTQKKSDVFSSSFTPNSKIETFFLKKKDLTEAAKG
jgi:hypothetical protein